MKQRSAHEQLWLLQMGVKKQAQSPVCQPLAPGTGLEGGLAGQSVPESWADHWGGMAYSCQCMSYHQLFK